MSSEWNSKIEEKTFNNRFNRINKTQFKQQIRQYEAERRKNDHGYSTTR